jgi:S1-C subfamily serine protease
MRLSETASRLTIGFKELGAGRSRVTVQHRQLPDDDLGLFETTGYGHYWRQHLESLSAVAEKRPSDHHHRMHAGVYFIGGHPVLGVLVGGVVRGSPVHRAGLLAGDVLQAIDGVPVRSIVEFDTWLDSAEPGSTACFSLLRKRLSVHLPNHT